MAFVSDRVCTVCATRYTPPTPIWAGIVFIIAGLALAGFFGLAWIIGLSFAMPPGPVVMGCEGFLVFLGVMAIIFGIRSLIKASEK